MSATPISDVLSEEAKKAITLLNNLKEKPADPHTGGAVTPYLLKKARGVLFLFTRKGGFGVAFSAGVGFSMTKVSTRSDGTATWSAPCFLTSSSVSMGGTIGMHDAASLSCMLSDRAASFMQKQGLLESTSADAHLTAVKHDWIMGAAADLSKLGDAVSVGWSEGFLIDLSIAAGELRVDKARNREVYGREVAPEELLTVLGQGGLPSPPQFQPVFAKLNEMILSCKDAQK